MSPMDVFYHYNIIRDNTTQKMLWNPTKNPLKASQSTNTTTSQSDFILFKEIEGVWKIQRNIGLVGKTILKLLLCQEAFEIEV